MSKKTVLVSSVVSEHLLKRLSDHFNVISPFKSLTAVDAPPIEEQEALYLESLPKAHGIIGFGKKVSHETIAVAHKLQCVATTSVGYDNLDVPLLTENGICLGNTPEVLSETVADLGLALMLSASRRIVELDRKVKAGLWGSDHADSDHYGVDMHGKTLGIVGLGHIGAAIARRAHFGFRMPILYAGNSRKESYEKEFGAAFVPFDDLCRQADFICVICPLTPQTFQLFKAEQFEMMKKTAVFVNIARGKVVDEKALIHALQTKQIFAAGLDVYETEPLRESPLFSLPNVVTVPHIGSSSISTHRAIDDRAFDNLSNVLLRDEKPIHFINPQVWEHRRKITE